ncbi:Uncharacterized protein ALO80_04059 [Pseudomonas caricapapayae]|uniref:hypothetical protein n=1 Tax=Pseudomonas caricapapayae TaxID=46678 RepID=UPI0006D609BA|nr:hypothetical protein [Pseudomonas caricapapayae]KAA8689603.1 hypothetical protein F4W67_27655 [Pseudomonas caricapapayae]KPW59222.1 Uncharacterized protein ALO80_04059 [Pseudomonas caricapapayae]
MTIDWSKAPEGATHYYKGSPQPWRDLSGYNWKYFMNGKWHLCPSCCTSAELMRELGKVLFALPLPQAWNGEGLPPVGDRVERAFSHSTWKLTTICGHSTDGAYAAFYDGDGLMGWADKCKLRLIRTAEQIAAEEKEAGIQEMRLAAGSLNDFPFVQLWDAGYRKQVAQ